MSNFSISNFVFLLISTDSFIRPVFTLFILSRNISPLVRLVFEICSFPVNKESNFNFIEKLLILAIVFESDEIFKSLTKEQIGKIVELEINKLVSRVSEIGYTLQINKTAKDHLVEVGYDEEYGARPLNRAIQKHIEDPVSEEILSGRVEEGQTIKVSYSKSKEEIVIKIS